MTVGWWIDDTGRKVETDPETGALVDDEGARRTVRDFAAWALRCAEHGRSVEDMANAWQCSPALVELAIVVGRRHRAAEATAP